MSTLSALTSAERTQIDDTLESYWWDLSQVPQVFSSESRFEYSEFTSDNVSDTTFELGNEIRFTINEISQYIVPNKAFLEIKVTLTKPNASDHTTLANPMAHVLFEKARYIIGTTAIEDINDNYYYSALVKGLVSHTRAWIETAGYSQGWALDGTAPAGSIMLNPNFNYSVNAYNELNTISYGTTSPGVVPKAHAASNTGVFSAGYQNYGFFKRRMRAFPINGQRIYPAPAGTPGVPAYNAGGNIRGLQQTQETYVLKLPLADMFSFCRDVKTVFYGTKHQVVLNLNKKTDIMIQSVQDDGTTASPLTNANIKIDKISLWMPYVKPSTAMDIKLNNFLYENKMRPLMFYPTYVFSDTRTVPAATSYTMDYQVMSIIHRPVQVYFFMTHNGAGQHGMSRMAFIHNFIKNVQLKIGTENYPIRRIDVNMERKEGLLPYQMYLDCCGIGDDKIDPALSEDDWYRYYPIFCFELSTLEESLFTGGKTLHISAHFEAPTNQPPFQGVDYANANDSAPYVQSFNAFVAVTSERIGTFQTGKEGIKFISR